MTYVIGVFFILVSSITFTASIRTLLYTMRLFRNGTRTEGKIVRLIKGIIPGPNNSSSPTLTPVFQFRLPDQTLIEKQSNEFGGDYVVGDTVPIIYDKNDPHQAEIAETYNLWSTGLVGILLSLLAFTVGTLVIVARYKGIAQ